DFNSFSNISDEAFGVYLSIAKASSISLPLIKSATILTFLEEILAYLRVAFACGMISFTSSTFYSLLHSYFFVVVLSPACPLNVLVGANSPNLCPIISSEMYTGTCFLPSCTAIVCPTICGYIVEALDHVFITSFFPLSFIASILFINSGATNGTFLLDLDIILDLLYFFIFFSLL